MSWNGVAVVGVALVAAVAAADALRNGGDVRPVAEREQTPRRIDLATSRERPPVALSLVRREFAGTVSKVAVRGGTAAIGVSRVLGDERSRAAIQVWRGRRHLRTFRVPVGSFSLGLWFTDGGDIATVGWDETARLWTQEGRRVHADPYFAYETG